MKPAFYSTLRARLLVLFSLLSMACAAVARPQLGMDVRVTRPPGRLVDVGGFRLHLLCRGHGSPTVILESGLGGFSLDWIYVQDLVAADTRVCAYDRAGYGWSDPGPAPRTTDEIVDELERLLRAAGLAPPYVLVGHSFGGYTAQYFAKLYPREVAGVVLVDSSHPDQAERLPQLPADRDQENETGDLVTFFNPDQIYRYYPRSMWGPIIALLTSPKAIRTEQRELRGFVMSGAEVHEAGPMPSVPLVVVTRGKRVWPRDPLGNALERAWAEMQKDLAASVPGGRQVIARHSGHMIQLQQPEVVAAAVRSVLEHYCSMLYVKNGGTDSPRLMC